MYRDPQGGTTEENDWFEQRAVLPSATNKIKSSASTTSGAGGIGRTGADRQPPRAWKRAQPVVPDGDDPDGTGGDVEIMRAWKRVQPAVPAAPDDDDAERAGADAQLLRAWKRAQPAVPDGDDTEGAGADAQLLRAWKRTTQPTTADSDDTARTGTKDAIKRVWQRAQPEVSTADDNREKIVPNAQLLFAVWQRSQSWNGENTKGSTSTSTSDTGEDGESEEAEHYDDGSSTTVRYPRDNDPATCEKEYLENLGIFS